MIKQLVTKTTKTLKSSWICFKDGRNCERYSVSSMEEINEIIDELVSMNYKYIPQNNKMVYNTAKINGSYWTVKTNTYFALNYYWDEYNNLGVSYILFYGAQPSEMSGTDARSEVELAMKEATNDESWTFKKAFSIDGHSEVKQTIKECVMTAFDYANPKYINKEVSVIKEDISSAYVSSLLDNGGLPTLKGYKEVEGRIEPTFEYPFAFYTDGTLAIYGEFDSLYFKSNQGYNSIFYGGVDVCKSKRRKWLYKPKSNVKTILCKREYKYDDTLRDVFTDFFNKRKEDENNKFIMVACIGSLQMNSRPYCAHIAAVVIARCINRMINKYNYYTKMGLDVVLVNTDSIAVSNKKADKGFIDWMTKSMSNPKILGEFHTECVNGKLLVCSVKKYQLIDDSNVLTTKCAGLRKELKDKLGYKDILHINTKELLNVEVENNGKGVMIYE